MRFTQIASQIDPRVPNEILGLLLILGGIILVWDMLDRKSKRLKQDSGLSPKSDIVAARGSNYLPAKDYISPQLGLSSRPHGIVKENGVNIPVDVYPLSKKVKDRHVIQMLAHLRLVEELDGVKPPYGLLVMGKEARSVRIKNTDEKQRWLETVLDEMQSILGGVPAVPTPTFFKCKNCEVRTICKHSAYQESRPTPGDEGEEE